MRWSSVSSISNGRFFERKIQIWSNKNTFAFDKFNESPRTERTLNRSPQFFGSSRSKIYSIASVRINQPIPNFDCGCWLYPLWGGSVCLWLWYFGSFYFPPSLSCCFVLISRISLQRQINFGIVEIDRQLRATSVAYLLAMASNFYPYAYDRVSTGQIKYNANSYKTNGDTKIDFKCWYFSLMLLFLLLLYFSLLFFFALLWP